LRHLAPYVPPELVFLLDALTDEPDLRGCTGKVRNLDPALVDRVIEWGRQEWRRETLIDVIRIYDVYEPDDLEESPVVELCREPGRDTRAITNFDGAVHYFRACEHCTRTTFSQVKDLNVSPGRGPEVQWTRHYDWIVSERVRGLLEEYGVPTRPLLKNARYFQVLPPDTIALRTSVHPVLGGGPACPRCGTQLFYRTNWVEGTIPNRTRGMAICRHEYLLTVEAPERPITVALSRPRFNWYFCVLEEPNPRVGERLPNLGSWYRPDEPVLFVSRDLALELVRMKVDGFRYRPVKVQ
jgi:hypothetical protein